MKMNASEIMDYIYNNQEVMEKVRDFGYEYR